MSDRFDQQLRQIIPVADRWKELQAERNAIAEEGATIVKRLDELRPLCGTEAEYESAKKALEEIIALSPDELTDQHYAEVDRQEKRLKQMEAIDAELHQVDQTLSKNEARLDAIDKEIAPLNQQLDQFGELLSKKKGEKD